MIFRRLLHIPILFLICCSAQAAPITYEISWTGENGYTLEGSFSFDDALLGTGPIFADSLLTFSIEGFLGGASFGSFSGTPLSFVFDTDTEIFLVGAGNSQNWNIPGPNLGFGSAGFSQSLFIDGELIEESTFRDNSGLTQDNSRLMAAQIPLPAAVWLFGSALGLLGWMKRRAA